MTSSPERRKVVFVLGAPRSGTTLLGMMLGSHSRVTCLNELDNLDHRLRNTGKDESLCLLCGSRCPIWDTELSRNFYWRFYPQTALQRLLARLPGGPSFFESLFTACQTQVIVDTSKQVDWINRRLSDPADWRDADAHLLLITRDGRGTMNSWAHRYADRPFKDLVQDWITQMDQVEAVYDGFAPGRRFRLS